MTELSPERSPRIGSGGTDYADTKMQVPRKTEIRENL